VAIWCPYRGNIGTIRVILNLAAGLRARGCEVDLIRVHTEWRGHEEFLREHGVRLVDFGAARVFPLLPRYGAGFRFSMALLSLYAFPPLWWYLGRRKPDAVIICLLGFVPLLASRFAFHKPFNALFVNGIPTFNFFRKILWATLQRRADLVITVTRRTGDLIRRNGMPPRKIALMDHPVLDDDVLRKSREAVDHPWFTDGQIPVIVGIGRLTRQKDFPTLLKAFARVRAVRPCRLAIFGEGEDKDALIAMIASLGLGDDVWLAGFTPNPYRYLARADLFALSSRWEDPGHVIMEAAFLKVPIVATDCPAGPAEFLQDGAYGHLAPVGDDARLAEAILDSLAAPADRRAERVAGAHRQAQRYTAPACIDAYLTALGLAEPRESDPPSKTSAPARNRA